MGASGGVNPSERIPNTWLDRVLALPVIGLRIRPNVRLSCRYLDHLSPLIDRLTTEFGGHGLDIGIPGPTQLSIDLPDGFCYALTHEDLTVAFKPRVKHEQRPGRLPNLTVADVPRFRDLLERARSRANDLLDVLVGARMAVVRTGVYVSTSIVRDQLPPGVVDLLAHVQSFWDADRVFKVDAAFVVELATTDACRDQCHHILKLDETQVPPEKDVQFVMDWQRVRHTPIRNGFKAELGEAVNAAVPYFEAFGSGANR